MGGPAGDRLGKRSSARRADPQQRQQRERAKQQPNHLSAASGLASGFSSEKKIVILAGLISLSILPECPRRRPNSSGYRRSSSQAAGAQVGGRVSLVISLVVLSPTFRTCSRTITVGSVAARRMTLMLDSIKPASAFFTGLEKLDISGFRLWVFLGGDGPLEPFVEGGLVNSDELAGVDVWDAVFDVADDAAVAPRGQLGLSSHYRPDPCVQRRSSRRGAMGWIR